MKSKLLTVIGNIGSGKSTISPILAFSLEGKMIQADNLFQTTNPFREDYLKDVNKWAFVNELWLMFERVKILSKKMRKSEKGWMVVDSGLLMSWSYAYSHFLKGRLSKKEWQLFEDLFSWMTNEILQDSAVIRLKCRTNTLLERIKARGREYELKYYNDKYLSQIEDGIEALSRRLRGRGIKMITLGETRVNNFHLSKDKKIEVTDYIKKKL